MACSLSATIHALTSACIIWKADSCSSHAKGMLKVENARLTAELSGSIPEGPDLVDSIPEGPDVTDSMPERPDFIFCDDGVDFWAS